MTGCPSYGQKVGDEMARANYDFARRVQEVLEAAGYAPVVEPTVGGLAPDFVVALPNGETAIIETKSWAPTPENVERARSQADYYRQHLNAGESLVVLPSAPAEKTDDVVGIEDLVSHLEERARRHRRGVKSPASIEPPGPVMFCAMPFAVEYDDVFFVAMVAAAKQNSLTARRVDNDEFSGDIVAHIHDLIGNARLVVADVSESKPNVMYEVGYARGLGKMVVPICSTPLHELPFDVAHDNTIEYTRGRTHRLTESLAARITASMK